MSSRDPDAREEHERWEELAAADALGALDAADRSALAMHRARCDRCPSLDRDLQRTAARLLDAPGQIAPSPELRARVLRAVGEARRATARRRRRRDLVIGLSLAAGLATMIWIGVTSRAPALERVALAGAGPAVAAQGTAVIDRARGRIELVVRDLPALESSQSYELWWIDAGSPHPAGVFRSDPSGHARHGFDAGHTLPDSAVLAVTIEARTGAAAPSGPIVLAER